MIYSHLTFQPDVSHGLPHSHSTNQGWNPNAPCEFPSFTQTLSSIYNILHEQISYIVQDPLLKAVVMSTVIDK